MEIEFKTGISSYWSTRTAKGRRTEQTDVIVPLGLNDFNLNDVNDVVVSVTLTTLFFDAYVKDMEMDTSSSFNNVGHVDCFTAHMF